MSDSVRPHRWQPTRLPHPWDSPGKNTGVGCHFLLQCMKVKSESEDAQSSPALRDRVDCSLPGSSIHGIFQARVLEWGAIAFSSHCFLELHYYNLWSYIELYIRSTASNLVIISVEGSVIFLVIQEIIILWNKQNTNRILNNISRIKSKYFSHEPPTPVFFF